MLNMQGLGNADPRFLADEYGEWETAILRWISTSQSGKITSDYLENRHDGYIHEYNSIVEADALGDAIQISTGTENLITADYKTIGKALPDLMRPLESHDFLKTAKMVKIVGLEYYAYDVLNTNATDQDATVQAAIIDSANNINDAYVQTRHLRTMPVPWLINFFRPKFIVNDENILGWYEKTYDGGAHRADLSIGEPLPYSVFPYKSIKSGINDIKCRAMVGQLVKSGVDTYLVRYPLLCRAHITYIRN